MRKGRVIIVLAIAVLCVLSACMALLPGKTEAAIVVSDTDSSRILKDPVTVSEPVQLKDVPEMLDPGNNTAQTLPGITSDPVAATDQPQDKAEPAAPAGQEPAHSLTNTGPELRSEEVSSVKTTEENKAPDTSGAQQVASDTDMSADNAVLPEPKDEGPSSGDLVSEGDNAEVPHMHRYLLTSFKASNCEETGLDVYTCECGDSYEDIIPALGHQWEIASVYEVIDSESYCKFKCAVMTCTSPECIKDGRYVTAFSAKDYGYSYERLYAAYSEHASLHLANGKQASYTTQTAWCSEPAALYDQLLSEQNSKPHAVLSLQLIPAVTHIESIYRCSRCGAGQ